MQKIQMFVIAIVACMVIACQSKNEANYMILSGKVDVNPGEQIAIMAPDRSQSYLEINEDGSFTDTISGNEGVYYLSKGRDRVPFYVFHGNKLQVSFNVDDLANSAAFKGDKSDFSNYLVAKAIIKAKERTAMRELYALPEADFIGKVESSKSEKIALLQEYSDVPEDIRALEQKAIKIEAILSFTNYPRYYAHFAKVENYEPSAELKAKISDIDLNDEALYGYSDDYRYFLKSKSYEKVDELMKTGKTESMLMAMLMVDREVESDVMRETMMFESIKQSLGRENNAKEPYDFYMLHAKNEENRKEITELFAELSELESGKPSPKFIDYENYKGGTSSLDDFKGKYCYIDVWATWCGPCKAEIPHLQKVEKQYHNKNIEFVSISVDNVDNKDAWKMMVEEKEMGGVQLWAHNSDFMDAYKIKGIPRFILIDPNGNIVRKSAPRPSDDKLIDLFDELGI